MRQKSTVVHISSGQHMKNLFHLFIRRILFFHQMHNWAQKSKLQFLFKCKDWFSFTKSCTSKNLNNSLPLKTSMIIWKQRLYKNCKTWNKNKRHLCKMKELYYQKFKILFRSELTRSHQKLFVLWMKNNVGASVWVTWRLKVKIKTIKTYILWE